MKRIQGLVFLSVLGAVLGACASGSGGGFPSKCRSQCELAGTCEAVAFEDYPDFEVTRAEWLASCGNQLFAVAGECSDGTRVLRRGNGTTGELRLYDAKNHFAGLETTTDVSDETCGGRSYWPEVVPCLAPMVTEVLCGTILKVNDPVDQGHWGGQQG